MAYAFVAWSQDLPSSELGRHKKKDDRNGASEINGWISTYHLTLTIVLVLYINLKIIGARGLTTSRSNRTAWRVGWWNPMRTVSWTGSKNSFTGTLGSEVDSKILKTCSRIGKELLHFISYTFTQLTTHDVLRWRRSCCEQQAATLPTYWFQSMETIGSKYIHKKNWFLSLKSGLLPFCSRPKAYMLRARPGLTLKALLTADFLCLIQLVHRIIDYYIVTSDKWNE